MEEIKIVEYEPSLAAAVADMWTDSQEHWGGSSAVRTEEEVLQQEANSSNLNLYIALDGDKAVGYCGLSEYKGDEGALYIPLLNVRGDYHGKKIGKRLVLTAVGRTIELGWPRLDLYTWPGNTKAVPLYKKCGFFWEEDDESTHLMNFIPTVLTTEAVKDFFEEADWYYDSTREIEVKPDGRKENGFDYFEYSWKTDEGKSLRIEFERKGRGIRLIETDDYFISATVDHLKRVTGECYPIRYEITNKSGNPLDVSLNGIDDKNIRFSHFSNQMQIKDKETIEGTFEVGDIEEEQNPFKTHPAVTTKIKINGKEALFKTGIMPKLPANVSIRVPGTQCFTGVLSHFYLEMENNIEEKATFTVILPESPFLYLEEREFQIELKAGEKSSFPVPYRLSDYGFYEPKVDFHVLTETGKPLSFSKKITAAFKGIGTTFAGESDIGWHLFNGRHQLTLEKGKHMNLLHPTGIIDEEPEERPPVVFFVPKLGKPFSDEFSRMKPMSVDFFRDNGTIGLKATYRSSAFQGLSLVSHVKLYAEGLIEHWYEIRNLSEEEIYDDVWLYNPIFHNLYRAVIPYEGQIVTTDEPVVQDYEYWESNKVTENWLFSRHDDYDPYGICWSADYKVRFDDWFLYFEHHYEKIVAGGSVQTKPTFISIGAFQNWQDFRAFARQKAIPEASPTSDDVQFTVNDHNPIVKDKVTAVLKESKSMFLNGHVTVKADGKVVREQSLDAKDRKNKVSFDVPLPKHKGVHLLEADARLKPHQLKRQEILLQPNGSKVETKQIERQGVMSFEATNGLLTLKAAPNFFPALYSLRFQNEEWMDHAFPKPIARSWWNPWAGGFANHVGDLSSNSLAKESHSADFVSLRDNHGNEWSGISVQTEIKKHDNYKGLRFNQYYLMLPGVPVICHTTEIIQNTHRYFHFKPWMTIGFLNADWVKTQNNNGRWQTYLTRSGEIECYVNQSLIYGSEEHNTKLQVTTDFEAVTTCFYLNQEVTTLECEQEIHAEHGKRLFTTPIFFVLTDDILPGEALNGVKNLRFGKK